MKKMFLLFCASSFFLSNAQNTQNRGCAFEEKMEAFYQKNPAAKTAEASMYQFLSTNDYRDQQSKKAVVTIPVVVHVLYKNATQNISDAKIQSQIAVLNADFRKLNADFNTAVPAAFKPMAADMEVQFCFATVDPNGQPTTGIHRVSVPSTFDFDDDYCEAGAGGIAAWDSTKYLNIWVGAFTDTTLLGWAYGPAAAGTYFDGLCIDYRCYGTVAPLYAAYPLGRTGTHEIGHYFGLQHIWGTANYGNTPNSAVCGTTGWTDYCADTPATYYPYFGAPTFPTNQYACTNTANGSMFMNYMDYGNDAVLAMFSNDQKTILQNTLNTYRASLKNSNACATLGLDEVEVNKSIILFPSLAETYISIASPMIKIDKVDIFSADGRLAKTTTVKNETDKIDVSHFAAGTYYVRTYSKNEFVKSMKFIKK